MVSALLTKHKPAPHSSLGLTLAVRLGGQTDGQQRRYQGAEVSWVGEGGRWNDRKPLKLLGLLAMSLPGGKQYSKDDKESSILVILRHSFNISS